MEPHEDFDIDNDDLYVFDDDKVVDGEQNELAAKLNDGVFVDVNNLVDNTNTLARKNSIDTGDANTVAAQQSSQTDTTNNHIPNSSIASGTNNSVNSQMQSQDNSGATSLLTEAEQQKSISVFARLKLHYGLQDLDVDVTQLDANGWRTLIADMEKNSNIQTASFDTLFQQLATANLPEDERSTILSQMEWTHGSSSLPLEQQVDLLHRAGLIAPQVRDGLLASARHQRTNVPAQSKITYEQRYTKFLKDDAAFQQPFEELRNSGVSEKRIMMLRQQQANHVGDLLLEDDPTHLKNERDKQLWHHGHLAMSLLEDGDKFAKLPPEVKLVAMNAAGVPLNAQQRKIIASATVQNNAQYIQNKLDGNNDQSYSEFLEAQANKQQSNPPSSTMKTIVDNVLTDALIPKMMDRQDKNSNKWHKDLSDNAASVKVTMNQKEEVLDKLKRQMLKKEIAKQKEQRNIEAQNRSERNDR